MSQFPHLLSELKVLRLRRSLLVTFDKSFTEDRIHQCRVRPINLGVLRDEIVAIHGDDTGVFATVAAQGFGGDLGAEAGAVPRQLEGVLGVSADVLSYRGRVVVEYSFGPEGLEVFEVAGRGGGDHPLAGELGELDAENASCGAASVDEDEVVALRDGTIR